LNIAAKVGRQLGGVNIPKVKKDSPVVTKEEAKPVQAKKAGETPKKTAAVSAAADKAKSPKKK